MNTSKKGVTFVMAILLAGLAYANTKMLVDLVADQTIDVPEGTTTTVSRLTGGAFTLTKTGAGTLRIEAAYNRRARVIVRAGTLQTGLPEKPACLSSAWFHVDATDLLSMTTQVDGDRTLVTEWRDVDGGTVKAMKQSARPAPYLLFGGQNGRTLMDFGSLYNSSTATTGYGAMLKWDTTCTRPAEMFVVVGDTEDAKAVVIGGNNDTYHRNAPILGAYDVSVEIAPLIRNNPPTGAQGDRHSPLLLSGAGLGSSYGKALFSVDGVSVTPTSFELPDGMHLVSVYGVDFTKLDGDPETTKTQAAYALNAFAAERKNIYGGQRLGEVVILATPLTAEMRATVEDYLTAKWMPLTLAELELDDATSISMPDGGQIVVSKVVKGRDVTVTGNGELVADVLLAGTSISVRAGEYDGDVLRNEGSWFHVDASATDSYTTEYMNGTNFVTRWNDVNGGSVYASPGTVQSTGAGSWYYNMTGSTKMRCPWLETDSTSELQVLNFGSLANWVYSSTDHTPVVAGWGAAFVWSEATKSVCEILMVAGDTEDTTNVVARRTNDTASRCQALIGTAHNSNGSALIRGNPVTGQAYSPVVYTSAAYKGAKFAVDGSDVTGTTYCPAGGLHLFSVYDVPSEKLGTDASTMGAFARERYYEYGGQRLGEVLIFTNCLNTATRSRLSAALRAKWFGAPAPESAHENLSVAAGAVLRLPWQKTIVSGSLSLAGTLETAVVSATQIVIPNVGASVEGELNLGTAGGTVDLTGFPVKDYSRRTVRIVSSTATSGTVSGWSVTGLPSMYSAKLSLEADGLYANFLPPGIVLIVR